MPATLRRRWPNVVGATLASSTTTLTRVPSGICGALSRTTTPLTTVPSKYMLHHEVEGGISPDSMARQATIPILHFLRHRERRHDGVGADLAFDPSSESGARLACRS